MGKLLSQTYAISFKLSTFRYLKYLEIKAQYPVASTILVFSLVLRARETQVLVADTHVGIDPRTKLFLVVVVQPGIPIFHLVLIHLHVKTKTFR